MKIQLDKAVGLHAFTAYGDGYVSVNAVRHTRNILVLPDRLVPEWTQADFATLTRADFEYLAALDNCILLLGTGAQLRFPAPELLRPLREAGRSLEIMDTPAACRTYNLLVNEGRRVAAALMMA